MQCNSRLDHCKDLLFDWDHFGQSEKTFPGSDSDWIIRVTCYDVTQLLWFIPSQFSEHRTVASLKHPPSLSSIRRGGHHTPSQATFLSCDFLIRPSSPQGRRPLYSLLFASKHREYSTCTNQIED